MLQRNFGFKFHSSVATAQNAGREIKLASVANQVYYHYNLYLTGLTAQAKSNTWQLTNMQFVDYLPKAFDLKEKKNPCITSPCSLFKGSNRGIPAML